MYSSGVDEIKNVNQSLANAFIHTIQIKPSDKCLQALSLIFTPNVLPIYLHVLKCLKCMAQNLSERCALLNLLMW